MLIESENKSYFSEVAKKNMVGFNTLLLLKHDYLI